MGGIGLRPLRQVVGRLSKDEKRLRRFRFRRTPGIIHAVGWVEHDAAEIWRTQLAVARACLRKAGVAPEEVAAIGVTNQRETTVLWDRKTGEPIAPALVWQDRRTDDRCEALRKEGVEPLVNGKTGLRLDPYFSATKIQWLLDAVPGARARAEMGEVLFGTVDSWLETNNILYQRKKNA